MTSAPVRPGILLLGASSTNPTRAPNCALQRLAADASTPQKLAMGDLPANPVNLPDFRVHARTLFVHPVMRGEALAIMPATQAVRIRGTGC